MANNGFTKIRKGLLEHIEAQQFTAIDLGVYVYLHMRSNWRSGICWTNAKSVATGLGTPHATVKQVFRKLREKGYIQYPEGCGSRANYPVALINAEPTKGILYGCRVVGFTDSDMHTVTYDISTAEHPEDILKASAQHPERILRTSAEQLVNIPLQDLQDFKTSKTLQDFQNDQHEQSAGGAPLSDQERTLCHTCHDQLLSPGQTMCSKCEEANA